MTLSPPCYPLCVLEGVLNLDVSVQGDGAQAQYRGRGAHHVRADDVFQFKSIMKITINYKIVLVCKMNDGFIVSKHIMRIKT